MKELKVHHGRIHGPVTLSDCGLVFAPKEAKTRSSDNWDKVTCGSCMLRKHGRQALQKLRERLKKAQETPPQNHDCHWERPRKF